MDYLLTPLYRDTLDIEWVEVEHTVGYRLDGLPVWVPYKQPMCRLNIEQMN